MISVSQCLALSLAGSRHSIHVHGMNGKGGQKFTPRLARVREGG